jgi:hypothetical protein
MLLADGAFQAARKLTRLAALNKDVISHYFESKVLTKRITQGRITDDAHQIRRTLNRYGPIAPKKLGI